MIQVYHSIIYAASDIFLYSLHLSSETTKLIKMGEKEEEEKETDGRGRKSDSLIN